MKKGDIIKKKKIKEDDCVIRIPKKYMDKWRQWSKMEKISVKDFIIDAVEAYFE